jgi:hypothetical protein
MACSREHRSAVADWVPLHCLASLLWHLTRQPTGLVKEGRPNKSWERDCWLPNVH